MASSETTVKAGSGDLPHPPYAGYYFVHEVAGRIDKIDDRMFSLVQGVATLTANLATLTDSVANLFTRVGALEDKVEARVGAVETRVGAVEVKVDALESRMGAVEGKVDAVAADVSEMKGSLEAFKWLGSKFFKVTMAVMAAIGGSGILWWLAQNLLEVFGR